jgi:hypothetical protein
MTSPAQELEQHAQIWKGKPVQRVIYEDFYDRLTLIEKLPATTA